MKFVYRKTKNQNVVDKNVKRDRNECEHEGGEILVDRMIAP